MAMRGVGGLSCAVLAVALLPPGAGDPASAATATASFGVTATVQPTCLISVTTMAFPAYTGVADTATSTITITCTDTTPYNVGLDPGTAPGATVTTRQMGSGTANLGYALTSDAAHSVNWGQTVGTDTVAGTGNGTAQALTVYGQIAAGLFVAPGTYTDTIVATVTY